MNYGFRALKGFSLNSLVTILSTGLTAVRVSILAHLLSPSDFGLFSLTVIALGLTESITETGINTIIIQSNKPLTYWIDSAWVVAIIRGFGIAGLMIVIGFAMKAFYQQDPILPLVILAALVPVIKGFINPAIVMMYKGLHFFADSAYRLSLVAVTTVVSILLAFILHSAAVFIWGMIVSAIFEVIISFVFFTERPKLKIFPERIKQILQNGRGLNLATVLGYILENVDNLLIGKFTNTTQLGLYQQGYALSHTFNLDLAKSVQHSTFPVYTRIEDDRARLSKAYLKATVISMLAFSCLSIPIALFSNFIVKTYLGEKWLGVEPILPLLLIAGLIQSYIAMTTSLFVSCKQYFWLNLSLIVTTVSLILLLFLWVPSQGILGGVNAVLWSRIITIPFVIVGAWQSLRLRKA
jgi:PST family polysaccharide transporter/lipopolysaccharide exporter